jgi:hypothetical protein
MDSYTSGEPLIEKLIKQLIKKKNPLFKLKKKVYDDYIKKKNANTSVRNKPTIIKDLKKRLYDSFNNYISLVFDNLNTYLDKLNITDIKKSKKGVANSSTSNRILQDKSLERDDLNNIQKICKTIAYGTLTYIAGITMDSNDIDIIRQINNKDANRQAQARFREKNKVYKYIGNISVDFKYTKESKVEYLFTLLNRPIRVCGMVKNEGEPGGGPFWIKNALILVKLRYG